MGDKGFEPLTYCIK